MAVGWGLPLPVHHSGEVETFDGRVVSHRALHVLGANGNLPVALHELWQDKSKGSTEFWAFQVFVDPVSLPGSDPRRLGFRALSQRAFAVGGTAETIKEVFAKRVLISPFRVSARTIRNK